MKRKLTYAIATTVLLASAVGGLIYARTKNFEKCDDVLDRFNSNHACISTEEGVMVFELYVDAAPKSIDKFTKLSNENKFYDGLEVYRAAKDFVIQAGIQDIQAQYTGLDNLSDEISNKIKLSEDKIESEANFDKLELTKEEKESLTKEGYKSNNKLNTRQFEYGSLSFANAGPNTNSTEIFVITVKDKNNPSVKSLRGKFTNMGKIVSGQDVLDKINGMEVIGDGLVNKVKIFEIRVKK